MTRRLVMASTVLAMMGGIASCYSASAVPQPAVYYDLPAQDLATSLRAVGRVSRRQIVIASKATDGRMAKPLRGTYTPDDAISTLLDGTGIQVRFTADAVLVGAGDDPANTRVDAPAPEITVTGSRIAGAPVSSPVIRLGRQQIIESGASTVADAVRTIPQNFGGGQNPGVVGSPAGSNNTSSASSINLRGLGSSATLTLINGHRVSYDAEAEAVDISVIPLLAVDRIEVVPDGSSAIYGSDAVGGVANIILRRDFKGIETLARVGLATDGGDRQQQYDLLAGQQWSNGGALIAYDYERDSAIESRDRSYAKDDTPGLTLYPYIRHHNVLVSGHQEIGDRLTLNFDGFFNKRWSHEDSAYDAHADYLLDGGRRSSITTSFALAPSLDVRLGHGWKASLSTVYGQDHSRFANDQYFGGAFQDRIAICYCNSFRSAEAGVDGPLFDLPAGAVRAAVGGGARGNHFDEITNFGDPIIARQSTYYGYGEMNVPLVSPDMDFPLMRRLNLSGAVRYERSPGVGQLATPKFGATADLTEDIGFKASWGKSFRAPTLNQRFEATTQVLFPASYVGGSGYGPNATALYLIGGNPNLKPERATTWSTTLELHPRALRDAHFEISYFHVNFRNRIVAPVLYTAQALSRPEYADLVDLSPTSDQLSIVNLDSLVNITGRPYDPADVVAIVNNLNLNVASQVISGVDLSADYRLQTGATSAIRFEGSASYLKSRQRLSDLQPVTALAGTIFNPPHFRARLGAVWTSGGASVATYVNYLGGIDDVRVDPVLHVRSMTTWDISSEIPLGGGSPLLNGVSVQLTVNNLTNSKPGLDGHPTPYTEPTYDTTNYSPVGRFLSLTVKKRW